MLLNINKIFRKTINPDVILQEEMGRSRIGPAPRDAIRPEVEQEMPQHLTLPAQPFVLLAHHPTLDVLACRIAGTPHISLYVDGWDVTDFGVGVTVAEAAWMCRGPSDLVRKTVREKFNVELQA